MRKSRSKNIRPNIFKKLKNWQNKKTLGATLVAIGVFLVGVSQLNKTQISLAKETNIEEEVVEDNIQIDKGLLNALSEDNLYPSKIIIPSLNIDLDISPSKIVKGKWEVFEDKAGFGLGSALPGQIGNTVVFAHAREKLFLPLRKIKNDAVVYLFVQDKWFSYKISEIKEVLPTDVSVIAPTQDETLTLFTCSGFADSKRLIVIGKKI